MMKPGWSDFNGLRNRPFLLWIEIWLYTHSSKILLLWNYKSSKTYPDVSNSVCIFIFTSVLSPHIWKESVFPKRQNWNVFDKFVKDLAFLLLGCFFFVAILLPSPAIEPRFYSTLIFILTRFSRSEYKEYFVWVSSLFLNLEHSFSSLKLNEKCAHNFLL